MKIPIVNEEDEIIEYKERGSVLPQDIQRISCVWVFNKNKEILIAKRSLTKSVLPGKWSPSAAGTLEEGETYESNATKELEEEIGLKNVPLVPLKKIFYENGSFRRFCFVYIVFADIQKEKFILQESEVAEVRWISLKDFSDWYKKSPDEFTPSIKHTFYLIEDYLNVN